MNATTDPRAVMAARNNADWYAMMADLHDCGFVRYREAFVMLDPPPPFHGWMTTLQPDATDTQIALVADHKDVADFAIKDGFDRLDLTGHAMKTGFTAEWINADTPRTSDASGWEHITTPAALARWEAAWNDKSPSDQRQFPDAILTRPDVALWGRVSADGYDAGGIANLSRDCVGLSNVFGSDAFAPLAFLAQDFGDGLPCVGYERGDDLADAIAAGFVTTGPLRVWFRA